MARQLNLSNDSCLFCSDPADSIKTGFVDDKCYPIILDNEDVKAKVLKALCNQLMPQNLADIPVQFSEGMFPLCTSCKDLVTELWECQEVIRKTQLRLTEITNTIEKKVVEGVILDDQMPSSAATSDKRFIKLRDVILKHYRESLIFKREEELTAIHLATSNPVSVISEVHTAEASCSVIMSSPSSMTCDTDVNDATSKEYAKPVLPGVSISANESNQKISQSLFDNDSLFEEDHHVIKSESQSESEMEVEDPNEDTASRSEGEVEEQLCVNQETSDDDFKRHARKEIYQCSVCKWSFTSAAGVKLHHYKFHGAGVNDQFPCPICGYEYSQLSILNTHLRNGCWGRI